MYGAQTNIKFLAKQILFENDVEMYGAQTGVIFRHTRYWFENDVEMYGAQTIAQNGNSVLCLRMM